MNRTKKHLLLVAAVLLGVIGYGAYKRSKPKRLAFGTAGTDEPPDVDGVEIEGLSG